MVDRGSLEALLEEHFERRPIIWATDFYKLLYQGIFGVGHIMGEGAREWLREEAEGLDLEEQPYEPLLEEVSADGAMVRVNLRPYLRRGLPLVGLLSAMKETSKVVGSQEEFMEAWAVFKEMVLSGRLYVDEEGLESLDEELRREGCRPHHHSDAYRKVYHPTYRVVTRESLKNILGPEEEE